jgi:hypothetical protein
MHCIVKSPIYLLQREDLLYHEFIWLSEIVVLYHRLPFFSPYGVEESWGQKISPRVPSLYFNLFSFCSFPSFAYQLEKLYLLFSTMLMAMVLTL